MSHLSPPAKHAGRALLASVVIGLALTGDAAASPRCGQTITRDTRLTADLRDCPGNGLVIAADGVTLDLGGHTIDGDGITPASCAPEDPCDTGVEITEGRSRVRVINGAIRDFVTGVHGNGLAHTRVQRLSVTNSEIAGIHLDFGSIDSEVTDNRVVDNTLVGIDLIDSRRANVARNVVSGSPDFSAVFMWAAVDLTLEDNRISESNNGITLWGAGTHMTIRRNVVTHTREDSIVLEGAANRIEDNRLIDITAGIFIESDESHDNVIRGNLVTGSGNFGPPDDEGLGIIVANADRNLVEGNTVTGGRGPAIIVVQVPGSTPAEDNVIARNLVNSRLHDGISIDHGSSGTVVRENTAFGSGDDGIQVTVPSATLIANTAIHNRDYGIEAVSGVTDGGRNHAFANGNPLQCLNIAC